MSERNVQHIMNKASAKLRSKSGASISFALLLFLVCAVLSAAILVAGTVASGRMSGLAETDQRYYSVMSGAQMLSDKLDGKTVSTFTVDGTMYRIYKPMNEITEEMLTPDNVVGENETANNVAEIISDVYFSDDKTTTLQITKGTEGSPLDVTAEMSVDNDGDTKFTIYNKNGDKKDRVILTFATDVRNNNPPIFKEENVEDPVEITWHADRMIQSYDDR